jgi:hypothetical protein
MATAIINTMAEPRIMEDNENLLFIVGDRLLIIDDNFENTGFYLGLCHDPNLLVSIYGFKLKGRLGIFHPDSVKVIFYYLI